MDLVDFSLLKQANGQRHQRDNIEETIAGDEAEITEIQIMALGDQISRPKQLQVGVQTGNRPWPKWTVERVAQRGSC